MCITDDYNTALLISKNQPNRVKEFHNYHLALKMLERIVQGGIEHSIKPKGSFIHLDVSVNRANGNAEFRVMRGEEILLTANTIQYCTPNIAEFLALVEAHKYAVHYKIFEAIFCDNVMAIKWFKKQIPIKIPPTVKVANPHLVELVDKAWEYIQSLKEGYDVDVHHWDKSMWGEIPSDYNRKKPQINESFD